MKAIHALFTSFALCAPLFAQNSTSVDDADPIDDFGDGIPVSVQTYVDREVDLSIERMISEASRRGVSREAFNLAVQALQSRAASVAQSLSDGHETWMAMSFAVERLETQARSVYNDLFELHSLQVDVIDQRLDEALEELREAAVFRGADRETYERIRSLLTARAEAGQDFGPIAREIHNRLEGQVTELAQRAVQGQASLSDFQNLQLSVVRFRLNDALARLQEAALFRGATREDYNRAVQRYTELAQTQAQEIMSWGR